MVAISRMPVNGFLTNFSSSSSNSGKHILSSLSKDFSYWVTSVLSNGSSRRSSFSSRTAERFPNVATFPAPTFLCQFWSLAGNARRQSIWWSTFLPLPCSLRFNLFNYSNISAKYVRRGSHKTSLKWLNRSISRNNSSAPISSNTRFTTLPFESQCTLE